MLTFSAAISKAQTQTATSRRAISSNPTLAATDITPNVSGFGTASGPVLAEGVERADSTPTITRRPARHYPRRRTQSRVTRGTESGLPRYDEVAARTQLPPLHIDLHSYAPDPAKRFVLVNMHRLYEGQSTAEGVKVESITNDAAIMSYKGTRFVLDSE